MTFSYTTRSNESSAPRYNFSPEQVGLSSKGNGDEFPNSASNTVRNFEIGVQIILDEGLRLNAVVSQPERLIREDYRVTKHSTARALLRHAGSWVGDDLEECLKRVYESRGKMRF